MKKTAIFTAFLVLILVFSGCKTSTSLKQGSSYSEAEGVRVEVCGINNGKEYYFGITDKAYILLKDVSTCRLKIKNGVLGGLYITKYPQGIDERLAEKADKWLFKKGAIATVIFVAVVAVIVFV